ncbi:MAG: superoxide dismutase [Candidatus Sericytochromatia bacterium]
MKKTSKVLLSSIIALSAISFSVNAETTTVVTTKVEKKVPAFTVPKLDYAYNALEPYIDAKTMNIHLNKHHKTYVDNLNKAIKGTPAENMSIEEIISNVSKFSDAIRNNAGGHWNHSFFWKAMKPKPKTISKEMTEIINKDFGSLKKMQESFNDAGKKRFGSGWVWLIKKDDGKLEIISTPNQDNPLMDNAPVKGKPILACDVWEHAYYLKYQNKRADYLKAFWNVVDWERMESLYK